MGFGMSTWTSRSKRIPRPPPSQHGAGVLATLRRLMTTTPALGVVRMDEIGCEPAESRSPEAGIHARFALAAKDAAFVWFWFSYCQSPNLETLIRISVSAVLEVITAQWKPGSASAIENISRISHYGAYTQCVISSMEEVLLPFQT